MSTLFELTKFYTLFEDGFDFEAYYDAMVAILLSCPVDSFTYEQAQHNYYEDKTTGLIFLPVYMRGRNLRCNAVNKTVLPILQLTQKRQIIK